jgi:rod shape-determining protein MreC
MLKKPHIVAAGAVGLLVVILLSLPAGFTRQVKLTVSGVFLPIFGLSGAVDKATEKAVELVVPRKTIIAENKKLKEENDRLKMRIQQTETVRLENDGLRKMLGFPEQSPWKLIPARIIARDPSQWWRTAEINVGRRDGVFVNAPILTPEGLVGKVSATKGGWSRIILLGDANCQAAAQVLETGEHGIIKAFPRDPTIVTMTYLSKGNDARPGQTVISSGLQLRPGNLVHSSGLGGVFPKGIPVGQIMDVKSVGFGLYMEARVRLAVNLSKIDRIYVVTE